MTNRKPLRPSGKRAKTQTKTLFFESEDVPFDSAHCDYAHCVLPPNFFERTLFLQRKAADEGASKRTVLSIETWDGRDVMSVLGE